MSYLQVLSGIVGCVRPTISLSTLLSEEQLLQLVRLAVWSDWGPRALWGGPWVSHAICCLLQDLLEGIKQHISH
jgi:baculoviral IAP repeat-containing protein 6